MQAVGEYLIVRLPEAKKKTEGGIELPDDSKQPFFYGRIVSLGERATFLPQPENPKHEFVTTSVLVGDYAVFDPQGAVPIQLDPLAPESKTMVLHKEQVFAIVTADELRKMNLPT